MHEQSWAGAGAGAAVGSQLGEGGAEAARLPADPTAVGSPSAPGACRTCEDLRSELCFHSRVEHLRHR